MKKCFYTLIFLFLITFTPAVYAGDYLVGLSQDAPLPLSSDTLALEPVAPSVGVYSTSDFAFAQRLLAEGIIDYIEENAIVTLFDTPNDSYYSTQWNMLKCGIPAARAITRGSANVKVAVIDSGIQAGHPDFGTNILPGKNTIDGSTDINDVYGHGTAVTGIIGALSSNGVGIAGIADQVQILPIQFLTLALNSSGNYVYVTQNGVRQPKVEGGRSSNLIAGIEYALDQGCDVINISAGVTYTALSSSELQSFRSILDRAYEENVIVVAAAGNDGNATLSYPAADETVIGVGSIDSNNIVASSSQRNESVFVCAPGVSIPTTISNKCAIPKTALSTGYALVSGTSFAAPHVTALAALARSIDPDLTPQEFMAYLSQTALDLGTPGYDTSYGYGLIDMATLLNEVLDITELASRNPSLPKMRLLSGIPSRSSDVDALTDKLRNNTAQTISGTVITAFYHEDGSMAAAPITTPITLAPFSKFEYSIPIPPCYSIQRFFWSGIGTMTPLLPPEES